MVDLIPTQPREGHRVFTPLEWADLERLSAVDEAYVGAEAVVTAIDTAWSEDVEVGLAERGISLLGFEALVPGAGRETPFDESLDTIGLSALWLPTADGDPLEHPAVYAFARGSGSGTGATGLDPPSLGDLLPPEATGTATAGSLFVGHAKEATSIPDDWCRQVAGSGIARSAPLAGEVVAYDAGEPTLLTALADRWYHYAGRLAIEVGTDVTAHYGDVRYRDFDALLEGLGLRDGPPDITLLPTYRSAGSGRGPRLSSGVQFASASRGRIVLPRSGQSARGYAVVSRRAERAVVHREKVNLRSKPLPGTEHIVTEGDPPEPVQLTRDTRLYVVDAEPPATPGQAFYHRVVTADLSRTGWVASTHVTVGLPDPRSEIHEVGAGETAMDIATRAYGTTGSDGTRTLSGRRRRRALLGLLEANQGPGQRGLSLPEGSPLEEATARQGFYVWIPSWEWVDDNVPQLVATSDLEQEPCWSGTDVPPAHRRAELRSEAEDARDNVARRDADLRNIADNVEFERVIVGSGFGAVHHVLSSLPSIRQQAARSNPAVIAIEHGEMWDTFKPKAMGQSPSLLSPQGFVVPPLHFMKNPEGRFLTSTAFADAIKWHHDKSRLKSLHGTVTDITRELDGTYSVIVDATLPATGTSRAISVSARSVDVLSGLGPARTLSDQQITDADRETLRMEVDRHDARWRRLIYGEEALRTDRKIPPVPEGETMRVLIYGGSPTGAWAWERFHEEYPNIERPFEIYWLGYLRPEDAVSDSEENLKQAFEATMVGERNTDTLAASKTFRSFGEVTNVAPSGDGAVSVTFNDHEKLKRPPISTFDQLVVAIGREPARADGIVDILRDDVEVGEITPFIENRDIAAIPAETPDYRPIGVGFWDGSLRALGAAGVSFVNWHRKVLDRKENNGGLTDPEKQLKSEYDMFHARMTALIGSLPPEARVPPGITVTGLTIPLADNRHPALDEKLDVNTASELELRLGLTRLLNGDETAAAKVAAHLVSHRSADDHNGVSNHRGFDALESVRQSLKDAGDDDLDVYEQIKWDIRI